MCGGWLGLLLCTHSLYTLVAADIFKVDYKAYNNARYGVYPNNYFHGTGERSPLLQITTWDKNAISKSGSHIFIRHNGAQDVWGHQQASPLILDTRDLSAVYMNRSFPVVFNVNVQKNFDKKYLTFYGDKIVGQGLGDGVCYAYDTSYREAYKIAAQGLGVKADLHECEFTGRGTVIVSAYKTELSRSPASLKDKHKPTVIRESYFQELELGTNKVLFTWRASEHVDIYDSFEGHNDPWDFFHINTIEKTRDGNYLVSGRHMHSIYLISGKTGDIIWTLGGRKNEFVELPPQGGHYPGEPVLAFAWQHHTRLYTGNDGNRTDMTFFDNHQQDHSEYGCKAGCSRGLHVRLNTHANPKTVQLVQEYKHPAGLVSQSQGSMQVLDDGNVFIGWGRMPGFTEHTADGKTVLDVQFSPWLSKATADHALDNYRAFKKDWKASPYWPPEISVTEWKGAPLVYLSWNGATEVREWVLLATGSGDGSNDTANVVARVPRSGFETEISLTNSNASYLRAEALNEKHEVIGSTGIINVKSGELMTADTAFSMDIDAMEEKEVEDNDEFKVVDWDLVGKRGDSSIILGVVLWGTGMSTFWIVYALYLTFRRSE